MQAAEIVSKDYAFREAVATGDAATISSVLRNHGARINASVVMLVSPDNLLLADSLSPGSQGRPFPRPTLVRVAQEQGRASAILRIEAGLYQVVVVPVLAPDPIAWVAIGFSIDRALLEELSGLTALQVSFLQRAQDGSRLVLATTQPEQTLQEQLAQWPAQLPTGRMVVHQSRYDTIITSVTQEGSDPIEIALQRSVAEGLEPFEQLESLLALLTAASVLACVLGSIVLARRITEPIATLSRLANRARDGDYSSRVGMTRDDEIGELSASFDYMLESIEGRQAEILRLAYQDTITALPNRTLFNARLKEAVERHASEGHQLAVLLMDLDRFKSINDTLGHHSGDLVLQAVSERLRDCVREPDLVGRLGGDEFAILMVGDLARAWAVGRMVQGIFEQPISLEGRPIDVGLSIGIAHCPTHGEDPWVLLRRADIAMYAAKRNKSGIAVYDGRHDQFRAEHLSLLSDLRKAIAEDQLLLHYQPKLDLRRNQIVGVEALVRWQHPQRGMIAPVEFLPFAEQTGTIIHITRWVVESALRQCGAWRAAGLSLHVSLNVSSRDLVERDLPEMLVTVARRHAVPPESIIVEVTESALMEDPQRAQQILLELKQHRFRIAIDDYGTGYSSLAYLQRLHCDELKVDRTFTMHVAERETDAAIVRSTVDLGHSLGLSVVAEGVESDAVMQTLRGLGCDIAQGYGISPPIPAGALADWLATCPWSPTMIRTGAYRVANRLKAV
jgi:diguanylate cyclase (GGDEF)-like protein